jgi:hypothetical protein
VNGGRVLSALNLFQDFLVRLEISENFDEKK